MADVRLVLKYTPSATPRITIKGSTALRAPAFGTLVEDGSGAPLRPDYRIMTVTGLDRSDMRFIREILHETWVDGEGRAQDKDWGRRFWFDHTKIPEAFRARFHKPANRRERKFELTRAQFRSLMIVSPVYQTLVSQQKTLRALRYDVPEA